MFKQRHPQLSLRRSDPLDRNRAEALNSSIVNEYYDLLHTVLTDNNILNNTRQILNCDETFVPLDYSREKVVTTKGAKNVYLLICFWCVCVYVSVQDQQNGGIVYATRRARTHLTSFY